MKLSYALLFVGVGLACVSASAQTFTVLKTFNPNINQTGLHPYGTLVQAADGTFFGVTRDGGAAGVGAVFRVQPNGTGFVLLKSFSLLTDAFTNADGANPQAGLLLSGNVLYGTTVNGGPGGNGIVFSLQTNGSAFTVLKSFPALAEGENTDGANPLCQLAISGGTLYGTAQNGGNGGSGAIFRVDTTGLNFTNIYNFTGGSDGAYPLAGLIISGTTLYGTASIGGDDGNGTVFKIQNNGNSFTRLESFPSDPDTGIGTNGATPQARLVLSGSTLYGTTSGGGANQDGVIFSVSTSGSGFTDMHDFADNEGHNPLTEMLLVGSTLYGTAANGGNGTFYGTIFSINTSGSGYTVVRNLDGNDAWGPQGGLLIYNGNFYGTTVAGGIVPGYGLLDGTVYTLSTNGGGVITDVVAFTGINGAADPTTGLALSGNTLYGTTEYGGTNNTGTIYSLNTDSSSYAEIKDFSIEDSNGGNTDGGGPRAPLVLSGGQFYSTTRYGGTNGEGAVYQISPAGVFTNLHSFNDPGPGIDTPITKVAVAGTTIYGSTGTGGSNGLGSVFRLNTSGTGFSNIYNFTGVEGKYPGPITISVGVGTAIYGMTPGTGSSPSDQGAIFFMNSDGTGFTNIHVFSPVATAPNGLQTNSDGANPSGALIVTNGTIYGTAFRGGTNGQGTIFKMNLNGSGFTVLQSLPGTNASAAGPQDLLLSGSTLYGATFDGGTSGNGSIFQINTDGSGFSTLKSFTGGNDGANPAATLVLSSNTLYGATWGGGLSGYGVVFSLTVSSAPSPIPLSIRSITNAVVVTWTDPGALFSLQTAPIVTGTYSNLTGATSPYTNAITNSARFYRLKSN